MKKLFKFNWINGLGLSFIFTGFLYFLKLASDAGWLPPELRAAVGLVAGASGVYAGIQLFKKQNTIWGESISGFGIAMIYATLAYVSFTSVFSFSPNALLISMLSIGILTGYFAVKSNMRIFTLLATIGGLATPLIVKAPESQDFMLFIYLLIINVGCIYLSAIKKWEELKVVSFVLTLAIYSSYYVLFDPIHWVKPFLYITCFFVIYLVGVVLSTWKTEKLNNDDNLEVSSGTNSYLGILNAISFVFWATLILTDFDVPHLIPLGAVSVLFIGIGFVFYRLKGKVFDVINASYLIIGGLCLCIVSSNSGLVLNHGFNYVVNTVVWLLIIITGYFVGQKLNKQFIVLVSYAALLFLTGYWYVFAWDVEWVRVFGIEYIPFLNAGALVWIALAIAGFYFSAKEEKASLCKNENEVFDAGFLSIGLGVLSHVIVGGLLTVQISNLWEAYPIELVSKSLMLSICWMVYALGIFIWSVSRANPSFRKVYSIMGSVVLVLTSIKVFVWDLSGSATYQKVVFLMIVGGITLLAGYFFGKGKPEKS